MAEPVSCASDGYYLGELVASVKGVRVGGTQWVSSNDAVVLVNNGRV